MKLLILIIALLAGCASTPKLIVEQPTEARLPIPITSTSLIAAFKADAANLDQAVAIGAIPKDDPAPPCLHDFLRRAGIEVAPGEVPKSFVPDPAGKASIAYIQLRQTRNTPKFQPATSCYAILGELHFNAIMDAVRIVPLVR